MIIHKVILTYNFILFLKFDVNCVIKTLKWRLQYF